MPELNETTTTRKLPETELAEAIAEYCRLTAATLAEVRFLRRAIEPRQTWKPVPTKCRLAKEAPENGTTFIPAANWEPFAISPTPATPTHRAHSIAPATSSSATRNKPQTSPANCPSCISAIHARRWQRLAFCSRAADCAVQQLADTLSS